MTDCKAAFEDDLKLRKTSHKSKRVEVYNFYSEIAHNLPFFIYTYIQIEESTRRKQSHADLFLVIGDSFIPNEYTIKTCTPKRRITLS